MESIIIWRISGYIGCIWVHIGIMEKKIETIGLKRYHMGFCDTIGLRYRGGGIEGLGSKSWFQEWFRVMVRLVLFSAPVDELWHDSETV